MSALGQKQTYAVHQPMSALPPKATAKADIGSGRPFMNPRPREPVNKAMGNPGLNLESRPRQYNLDRSRG
jgi:hypothetical protein